MDKDILNEILKYNINNDIIHAYVSIRLVCTFWKEIIDQIIKEMIKNRKYNERNVKWLVLNAFLRRKISRSTIPLYEATKMDRCAHRYLSHRLRNALHDEKLRKCYENLMLPLKICLGNCSDDKCIKMHKYSYKHPAIYKNKDEIARLYRKVII